MRAHCRCNPAAMAFVDGRVPHANGQGAVLLFVFEACVGAHECLVLHFLSNKDATSISRRSVGSPQSLRTVG